MKKLVLLLSMLFVFNSCSKDDHSYSIVILPIESVTAIPTEFELGETYPITIKYLRPSTCHSPYGFYYEKDLNKRTFAARNLKETGRECSELTNILVEETFNFYVTSTGNYIFKFWTGTDSEGNNTYLEYDIPVN